MNTQTYNLVNKLAHEAHMARIYADMLCADRNCLRKHQDAARAYEYKTADAYRALLASVEADKTQA